MTQANAILGLIAQTSIHAGAGASVSAVDLPIQRESHNGWPCVFGSAVKGALRSKAENGRLDNEQIVTVFGPGPKDSGNTHAGAVSVGDARLLLLPMRTLTSTFKWVTCSEALKRFKRDVELLNLNLDAWKEIALEEIKDDVTCKASVHLIADAGNLFLEEYRFTATQKDLSGIIKEIGALMQRDDAISELEKRLVIISDDMFHFFAQYTTPVTAHIAIENDTKTVKSGALWYEETLPPETLLYVPLMAEKSRKDNKMNADDVRRSVIEYLFRDGDRDDYWLQVGGNETVGMGWCGVQIIKS